MDSEITERLRKLQLADLGSSRRDHISTDDNKVPKSKARSDIVLKAIDASRESNKSGTAAQKLAKKNEAQIEGWTSLHTKIGDTEGLELLDNMLDGQTHRLKMGINTSSQHSDPSRNGKNIARKPSGNLAGSKRPAPTPEPPRSAAGDSRKLGKDPPNPGAQRNSNTVPTKRRRPMEDFSRCISSPEDFLAYAHSMRETQTSLPVSKSESNVSRTEPDFRGVEAAKLACPPLPPAIKEMFSKNSVPVRAPATKEVPRKSPVVSPASASGSSKELPKQTISAPQPASKLPIGEIPKATPPSGAPGIPGPTSAAPKSIENGPSKIRVSLPKVSPSEPSRTSPAPSVAQALALLASAALISSSNPTPQKSTATILAQATSSTTSGMLKKLATDTLALSSSMAPVRVSSCGTKQPNRAVCPAPSNVGTASVSTSELSKNAHALPFVPSPPPASTRDLADTTANLSSGSGTPSLTPASLSESVHAPAFVHSPSISPQEERANKDASSTQPPPSTPSPAHSTKLLQSIHAPPFVPSPPDKSPTSASPPVHNRKLSQGVHAAPFVPPPSSVSAEEVDNKDLKSTLSQGSTTSFPPVTFKLPKAVAKTPAAVGVLLDFDAPQEPPSAPKSPGMEDLMDIDFQVPPAPQALGKLKTLQAPKAPLGKSPQSPMSPRQSLSPISLTSGSRGPTPSVSGQSRTILGDHNLPGRRHGVIAGDLGDSIYAEAPGLRKRWVLS